MGRGTGDLTVTKGDKTEKVRESQKHRKMMNKGDCDVFVMNRGLLRTEVVATQQGGEDSESCRRRHHFKTFGTADRRIKAGMS